MLAMSLRESMLTAFFCFARTGYFLSSISSVSSSLITCFVVSFFDFADFCWVFIVGDEPCEEGIGVASSVFGVSIRFTPI